VAALNFGIQGLSPNAGNLKCIEMQYIYIIYIIEGFLPQPVFVQLWSGNQKVGHHHWLRPFLDLAPPLLGINWSSGGMFFCIAPPCSSKRLPSEPSSCTVKASEAIESSKGKPRPAVVAVRGDMMDMGMFKLTFSHFSQEPGSWGGHGFEGF
jgi:hypothetical protein